MWYDCPSDQAIAWKMTANQSKAIPSVKLLAGWMHPNLTGHPYFRFVASRLMSAENETNWFELHLRLCCRVTRPDWGNPRSWRRPLFLPPPGYFYHPRLWRNQGWRARAGQLKFLSDLLRNRSTLTFQIFLCMLEVCMRAKC